MVAPRHDSTRTLIDDYLAEQSRLQTPVARLAAAHGTTPSPAPAARAGSLIPLSAPGPGEQYAFEVDLDACTGCKSCVAACHALNGLDERETWRDVGTIISPSRAGAFSQTITTACHHCEDPACLHGCPVLAYEKDPVTGTVRHLDDQCIGCSYCILKCPYDVPKFSERLGIVRKCDLCHDRLAHNEAPACVQACPTEAIRVVHVHRSSSSIAPRTAAEFLPTAPDPAYTRPTTRYVSNRSLPPDLTPADGNTLQAQPAHWPLVGLLTLLPMSIGCGGVALLLPAPHPHLAVLSWLAGAAALAVSVLHLGQPLRAWRVFLGLRRSWLSREAVVLGSWFPIMTLDAALRGGWLPPGNSPVSLPFLGWSALGLGVSGLACSVMVYADTQRRFWRIANTAPRFFGSALILGLAGGLATSAASPQLGLLLAAITVGKMLWEAQALTAVNRNSPWFTAAEKTSLLLGGELRPVLELRAACAVVGGIALPLVVALQPVSSAVSAVGLGLCLAGELLERSLFFRAVDAPKMPGNAG